jgi:hypothetical protein
MRMMIGHHNRAIERILLLILRDDRSIRLGYLFLVRGVQRVQCRQRHLLPYRRGHWQRWISLLPLLDLQTV